jgi:hypothetical protein
MREGTIMRRSMWPAATLVLTFWLVGAARADGLGPRGLEELMGIGLSLVVGGSALAVAAVVSGFLLVRGRRYHPWPRGAWRRIGYLALAGVLALILGPLLTFQFGLLTALVAGGVGLVGLIALMIWPGPLEERSIPPADVEPGGSNVAGGAR